MSLLCLLRGGRLTDATVRARHRCRLTVLRQREENVEGNPPRTGTARGVRSILPVDILMPLTLSFPWKSRRAARAPHLRASARKRVLPLPLSRDYPPNRNKRTKRATFRFSAPRSPYPRQLSFHQFPLRHPSSPPPPSLSWRYYDLSNGEERGGRERVVRKEGRRSERRVKRREAHSYEARNGRSIKCN